jgi:hypothetical protein
MGVVVGDARLSEDEHDQARSVPVALAGQRCVI